MSLKDTLQKNLTPELFEQVVDTLGDDFNFDLVPRSRLNKVIKQRDEARNALTGGKQPSKHGTKSKKQLSDDDDDDDDDEPFDAEAFKQQLQEQSNQAIEQVKIQYAALEQLRAANVIDPEMLWSSSVLDKTKVKLGADGKLTGLTEQLEALKEPKPHLFKKKEDDVPPGTGKKGGNEFEGVTTKEKFLELDVDKQIAFKEAHPETFKQFMSTM